MDFQHFTAGPDDDGRRLDRILKSILPSHSLSGMYKALRSGLIKVDGKKQKPDFHVTAGSDIGVAVFLLQQPEKKSADCRSLDPSMIVFRNEALLFLNKPYDIPVQKAGKNDTALDELVRLDYEFHHPQRDSIAFKTGPLHRLDRLTTGLICFSQNLEGAKWFSNAIQNHEAVKTYVALVCGKMKEKQHWEDKIAKNDENSSQFHTVSVSSEGKIAVTDAIPLQSGVLDGESVTLVKFIIYTGRTHQIRSTSSAHGFPLYGDTAYGGRKSTHEQKLYLHAYHLHLPQNTLGLPGDLLCPLGINFTRILQLSLINPKIEL